MNWKQLKIYEPYLPALFFIGGFLFDVLTLDRIDSRFQLVQQLSFLFLAYVLLLLEANQWRPESPGWLKKLMSYQKEFFHFLVGGLLSAYFIFFFKSSSFSFSLVFLLLLGGLLVLNEVPILQKQGQRVRLMLFQLCLCCFTLIMLPLAFKTMGLWVFVISVFVSSIFSGVLFGGAIPAGALSRKWFLDHVLVGLLIVHGGAFVCYSLKIIPPVPLAVKKIGVYEKVTKLDGKYHLEFRSPWWRFWGQGGQEVQNGNKVVCFASVFAPHFFQDKVYMDWWFLQKEKWVRTDHIPLTILGGREQGFRGYTIKQKTQPGRWKVLVMSSDKREMGRVSFRVLAEGRMAEGDIQLDTY